MPTTARPPLPALTPDDFGFPKGRTWFAPSEVARYLGCSDRTITREIASGQLEAVHVGRGHRISRAALEAYFRRQQHGRSRSE